MDTNKKAPDKEIKNDEPNQDRSEIRPYKNNEEAMRMALSLMIDTPPDRLPETTQMPGFLIYDMTLDKVRERAYDLNRDPATEPLSQVDRDFTFRCLRGKNFKYFYTIGNMVGMIPNAGSEEESFRRKML